MRAGKVRVYSYDYVVKTMKSCGFTLLETSYDRQDIPLNMRFDSCGHEQKVPFYSVVRNGDRVRCVKCADLLKNSRIKEMESHGFKVEPATHGRFRVECGKGHVHFAQFLKFKRLNFTCQSCRKEMGSKKRVPIEAAQAYLDTIGYKILGGYRGAIKSCTVQCPAGHIYTNSIWNFKTGKRCGICSGYRPNHETLQEKLKKAGYKLKSDFVNSKTKVLVECPAGHDWRVTPDNLAQNRHCPKCRGRGVSRVETDWLQKIREFYPSADKLKMERKSRRGSSMEFDIFIPEIKLAIEVDGIYWHSEQFNSRKRRLAKMQLARDLGIDLLVLYDDELRTRENAVMNLLTSKLLKNSNKIHARKCEIKELPIEQARIFFNDTHVQGFGLNTKVSFGLFYNSELVAAVSGSKHHRSNDYTGIVLNRLSFAHNTTVMGGASKLVKALKEYAKKNGYDHILSWSDNRISNGNVYRTIGFYKTADLPPSYDYIKGNSRCKKQSFTKGRLKKLGAIGDTEKDMAKSIGYYRLWDCGKQTWRLDLCQK